MGEKIVTRVLDDESFFFFIASIDYNPSEKADDTRYNDNWEDEKNWIKANPNLGVSVKLDFLRSNATTVKNDPSSLNNFLTKYMDLWVSQVTRWMPMDKWALCSYLASQYADPQKWRIEKLVALKGREGFFGIDLSEKLDITAMVGLFPPVANEKLWTVIPWFWIPKDTMYERAKADRVPYDVWERGGFVNATEGNAVDYSFIETSIKALRTHIKIKELGYDPWNATQFCQKLQSDGCAVVEVPQNPKALNEACKELMKKVVAREIEHGNNPVLTWMASNVAVYTDSNGNIKPDKAKSAERIDGIAALVIALSRAIAASGQRNSAPRVFTL
jgi:phage terminase large subunit-like protein